MSTRERHLHVYNARPQPTETIFPYFTRLPLDLRLIIWEYAVAKERFLRAQLHVDKRANGETPGDSGKAQKNYQVTLEGRKLIPKFLHVGPEARRVALSFYRVRMPCRYSHAGAASDGTFYFNPEHDILKLSVNGRKRDGNGHTIRFFKDLQSADPKGVGLQNVAVDGNLVSRLAGFQLNEMTLDRRETLTSTLSKLRRVYILSVETAGRMFLGPLNGVRTITGFEMHRSRPVLGFVPAFQRIPKDPRPIERDLKRTFLGTQDPLQTMYNWKRLLKKYNIAEISETEYSLMLCCSPGGYTTILDTESAEQWIAQEDTEWQRGMDEWEQSLGPEHVPREEPDDLLNAPQTAIGFWLFPIQALGDLPSSEKSTEEIDEHFMRRAKRVVDLSAYRPQLGVMAI